MSAHKEARAGWGLCQSLHPEPVGREPGCRREGKLETVNPVPHDIIPIHTYNDDWGGEGRSGGGGEGLGRVLSAGLWGPQHRSRTQSVSYSLYFHVTHKPSRGCCSPQCHTKPAQSLSSWVCPPAHQLLSSFMGTSGRMVFAASSCHLPPLLGLSSEWGGQPLANACPSPSLLATVSQHQGQESTCFSSVP